MCAHLYSPPPPPTLLTADKYFYDSVKMFCLKLHLTILFCAFHLLFANVVGQISRMEHQQHQHLQQLVSLDAVENSQARALLLKLINVALTVLQVVLLLVATLSNIIMPFLRTRYGIHSLRTSLKIIFCLGPSNPKLWCSKLNQFQFRLFKSKVNEYFIKWKGIFALTWWKCGNKWSNF